MGEFFGFMGLYIPFFYIQSYALKSPNSQFDESFAFWLLVILNAGSFFGRIIPNFQADKTGPLNMLLPCAVIASLLAFCWTVINSKAGLIFFAILYGFFSGTFVSLAPAAVVTLSPDLAVVGTRMGMSFTFAGLGLLVGNPVAGAILGSGTYFTGVQAFCGGTVAVSFVLLFAARLCKVGPRLKATT